MPLGRPFQLPRPGMCKGGAENGVGVGYTRALKSDEWAVAPARRRLQGRKGAADARGTGTPAGRRACWEGGPGPQK
jgi:hypothetical protein